MHQWQPHIHEKEIIQEAGMRMLWFNVFFGRYERHGRYTMSSSYKTEQEAKDAVLIRDFYVCTVPVWLPIKGALPYTEEKI